MARFESSFEDSMEGFREAIRWRTEELYDVPDAVPDENGNIKCIVIPMRDAVVFPHMLSPIFASEKSTRLALRDAQDENSTIIALNVKDMEIDRPSVEDFFPIGVEAAVGRLLNLPDGSFSALIQGRRRVEIVDFIQQRPYFVARAIPLDEYVEINREIDATMRTAVEMFEKCVKLDRSLPEEAYLYALNIEEPGWLADMVVTAISPSLHIRLKMLLTLDPVKRLQRVIELLANEAQVLELEDEIHTRTQSQVDRTQREYYLREQMKVIQSELGEDDPWVTELKELRTRVESVGLPEEAQVRALKEVDRLSQISPVSPEVGILRAYVDWILELPWHTTTEDNLDVRHASRVLNAEHYGLDKAKERILEYIAVRSLNPKRLKQPILCFVGPPGTGKTSLGCSIAKALGRKFVRLSLGGVRDEAEIRGHRRTYIGALPGRILQTMRRAGTLNPLFMLDEIDKLGLDFRGDPAAALLEVLDPEQNHAFSDHYLELPYDLSKVMFITTANTTDTIPSALLDRMEIIEFPGYIDEEKVEIAKRFLIPRQMEENGLELAELTFEDAAIMRIIREYTYEAGVRNLEREIGRICRKIARQKAEKKRQPASISVRNIARYLGPQQFYNMEAERKDEVGVATAIAWTQNGGEIMPVEVMLVDGKGNVQITGQVGDVMQESAQAALTFIKSRSRKYKIDEEIFDKMDVHIHIPEGAIPKDGPSAGITICTALLSAFASRKVRHDVGMTGEITLRGRVLPVGGIKEKILAAHRAGLKTVIIPQKNKKDLVEIPKKVRSEVHIVSIENMDQVLKLALVSPTSQKKPSKVETKGKRKKMAKNTSASSRDIPAPPAT